MPVIYTPLDTGEEIELPGVGDAQVLFTTAAGRAINLTNRKEGWFLLANGTSGLGAADYEMTMDPSPRGGAALRHVQAMPRSVVLPIQVWGSTHTEFQQRWRDLASVFTSTLRKGAGTLEIARPDGVRRSIAAYYQEGIRGLGTAQSGRLWDVAVVTLWCENPYWKDVELQSVSRSYSVGQNFRNPFPRISSGQTLGATTVYNPGDVVVWPEWTIYGPASGVTMSNLDTGEAFTIDPAAVLGGGLAWGEKIVVATDPPRIQKWTSTKWTIGLGAATAGTIKVTVSTVAGSEQTISIARNATAATVQAALEGLVGINSGDVSVTGGPLPGVITLSFVGQYLALDVASVTVQPTGLTGGTVTVTKTVTGLIEGWIAAINFPAAVLWGLEPGENNVSFSLASPAAGSSVSMSYYPRYETA